MKKEEEENLHAGKNISEEEEEILVSGIEFNDEDYTNSP